MVSIPFPLTVLSFIAQCFSLRRYTIDWIPDDSITSRRKPRTYCRKRLLRRIYQVIGCLQLVLVVLAGNNYHTLPVNALNGVLAYEKKLIHSLGSVCEFQGHNRVDPTGAPFDLVIYIKSYMINHEVIPIV